MKKILIISLFLAFFIIQNAAIAIEATPHISDREIVERLTRLEEGQKKLEEDLKAIDKGIHKRIDDLRSEVNGRFEEVNHHFGILQWMFGLFVTIAIVILGFVLRMQWQMHRRQVNDGNNT
ncbi:MAG: hypothetical protein FJ266_12960 [Planctomycetes bacterium]|nr:hypothetical protein [Planctomycetota bacterium]